MGNELAHQPNGLFIDAVYLHALRKPHLQPLMGLRIECSCDHHRYKLFLLRWFAQLGVPVIEHIITERMVSAALSAGKSTDAPGVHVLLPVLGSGIDL